MLVRMITRHHDPPPGSRLVHIVHLADQISVQMHLGLVGACGYPMGLARGVFEEIGVSREDAARVARNTAQRIERAAVLVAAS
jgi:hypothetical protein